MLVYSDIMGAGIQWCQNLIFVKKIVSENDQSAYKGTYLKLSKEFYNYGKGTPVRKYKSSSRTGMLSLLGRRKIESFSISSSMCLNRHQSSCSVTSPVLRALSLQIWKWDGHVCLAFEKKFFKNVLVNFCFWLCLSWYHQKKINL